MAEPADRDPRRMEPPLERVTRRPGGSGEAHGTDVAGEAGRTRDGFPPELPTTVRLGSRGREPVVLAVVIGVFLAAALWKPWAPPAGPRPLVQAPPTPHPAELASPAVDPLRALRAECEDPAGWRVYSHESFLDQVVRVWRSVAPAAAAGGPLDRAIPLVPAGPANRGLGYCAPWDGPDTPPPGATVTAWRIVERTGAPDEAVAIRLHALRPSPADPRGALYGTPGDRPGPLDGRTGLVWPSGRYVFAVRAGGWERWWAVEILPDRDARR
jgi:hypothetical protein